MLVLHFFICFLGSHTTFHLSSLPQQWAWKPGMGGLQKSPKRVLVSIFFIEKDSMYHKCFMVHKNNNSWGQKKLSDG